MPQSDHMTEPNDPDHIDKLVDTPESDHMTEPNDPDHIDKLVDMPWSDHMTLQNKDPVGGMLSMDSKALLIRSRPRTTRPYQSCYSCMFHYYHNKSL